MKYKNIYKHLPLLAIMGCSNSAYNHLSNTVNYNGTTITNTVIASFETEPVKRNIEDDAADDPLIWINTDNPYNSLIMGSDKKGGIATYNFQGNQIYYDAIGKINNIDIRQNIIINGNKFNVIGGTNRTDNIISFATLDNQGKATYHLLQGIEKLKNVKVYGFCFGYIDNQLSAFVNDKKGNVYIYDITQKDNQWIAQNLREFKIDSQTEGMVVDETYGFLYIGEENVGIWKVNLKDLSKTLISKSSETDNSFIKYDIEGLTLYKTNDRQGYLIASSQGNNSYAVFDRTGDNHYITSFRITDGPNIDGTEETDGIDAVNFNFGSKFPKGIFIAQDGFNFDGDTKKAQNFKVVDWQAIQKIIDEAK